MKILLAVPLMIFAFFLPLITGLMVKDSPYKFGLWFYISIPLLFVTSVIILCQPGRSGKKAGKLSPVENEEIVDHLFVSKDRRSMLSRQLVNYKNICN